MSVAERFTPTEAKRNLATILSKVEFGHNSVIVQRHGRDIAALIPIELYELVRKHLQDLEDEEDWREIQRALADPENAVPIPWDPARYGNPVLNSDASEGRQGTPPRAISAAKKGARSHKRTRR